MEIRKRGPSIEEGQVVVILMNNEPTFFKVESIDRIRAIMTCYNTELDTEIKLNYILEPWFKDRSSAIAYLANERSKKEEKKETQEESEIDLTKVLTDLIRTFETKLDLGELLKKS